MKVTGTNIKRVELLDQSKHVILLDIDLHAPVGWATFISYRLGKLTFDVGDSRVEWQLDVDWRSVFMSSFLQDPTSLVVTLYNPYLYAMGNTLWEE